MNATEDFRKYKEHKYYSAYLKVYTYITFTCYDTIAYIMFCLLRTCNATDRPFLLSWICFGTNFFVQKQIIFQYKDTFKSSGILHI